MAKQSVSRVGRSQGCLIRGIDPIPEGWEFASGCRARVSLHRSSVVLKRLIADAVRAGDRAFARDLRGIDTSVQRARTHLSGGFRIREIQPLAQQNWTRAERYERVLRAEARS
jgi:hypothetical protein